MNVTYSHLQCCAESTPCHYQHTRTPSWLFPLMLCSPKMRGHLKVHWRSVSIPAFAKFFIFRYWSPMFVVIVIDLTSLSSYAVVPLQMGLPTFLLPLHMLHSYTIVIGRGSLHNDLLCCWLSLLCLKAGGPPMSCWSPRAQTCLKRVDTPLVLLANLFLLLSDLVVTPVIEVWKSQPLNFLYSF